ncbi:unnamed protein product, partial [Didymodactylos carnosus]
MEKADISVSFWGAMRSANFGPQVFCEDPLDGPTYIQVISNVLSLFIKATFCSQSDGWFLLLFTIMGAGSSVHLKCSQCHMTSFGHCDHCHYRYCQQHFHGHVQTCPGAQRYSRATLRCIPECLFCNNDAT